jgi:hypothetical protein
VRRNGWHASLRVDLLSARIRGLKLLSMSGERRRRSDRLDRAIVTKSDAELIEEAVAAGRLRKIPSGVSGLPPIVPTRAEARRSKPAKAEAEALANASTSSALWTDGTETLAALEISKAFSQEAFGRDFASLSEGDRALGP